MTNTELHDQDGVAMANWRHQISRALVVGELTKKESIRYQSLWNLPYQYPVG